MQIVGFGSLIMLVRVQPPRLHFGMVKVTNWAVNPCQVGSIPTPGAFIDL